MGPITGLAVQAWMCGLQPGESLWRLPGPAPGLSSGWSGPRCMDGQIWNSADMAGPGQMDRSWLLIVDGKSLELGGGVEQYRTDQSLCVNEFHKLDSRLLGDLCRAMTS